MQYLSEPNEAPDMLLIGSSFSLMLLSFKWKLTLT